MNGTDRTQKLQVALTLLESRQCEQAELVCRQIIAQERDDIEATLLLALAIGIRGDAEAAAPIAEPGCART